MVICSFSNNVWFNMWPFALLSNKFEFISAFKVLFYTIQSVILSHNDNNLFMVCMEWEFIKKNAKLYDTNCIESYVKPYIV